VGLAEGLEFAGVEGKGGSLNKLKGCLSSNKVQFERKMIFLLNVIYGRFETASIQESILLSSFD
jgi:hypothetical protein